MSASKIVENLEAIQAHEIGKGVRGRRSECHNKHAVINQQRPFLLGIQTCMIKKISAFFGILTYSDDHFGVYFNLLYLTTPYRSSHSSIYSLTTDSSAIASGTVQSLLDSIKFTRILQRAKSMDVAINNCIILPR